MNKQKGLQEPLKKIGGLVNLLNDTSDQLLEYMDQQIDAIVRSDIREIEHITELHSELSADYAEYEEQFIEELRAAVLEYSSDPEAEIRLTTLEKLFPESEAVIGAWREALAEQTRKLQQRHDQIMQLLEFALQQNGRMLNEVFTRHNEKGVVYGSEGLQSPNMTGISVNQEA